MFSTVRKTKSTTHANVLAQSPMLYMAAQNRQAVSTRAYLHDHTRRPTRDVLDQQNMSNADMRMMPQHNVTKTTKFQRIIRDFEQEDKRIHIRLSVTMPRSVCPP